MILLLVLSFVFVELTSVNCRLCLNRRTRVATNARFYFTINSKISCRYRLSNMSYWNTLLNSNMNSYISYFLYLFMSWRIVNKNTHWMRPSQTLPKPSQLGWCSITPSLLVTPRYSSLLHPENSSRAKTTDTHTYTQLIIISLMVLCTEKSKKFTM